MKMLTLVSALTLLMAGGAARSTGSPTYSQIHSDVYACPSDAWGLIAGFRAGDLAGHLNGEIAAEADRGMELTSLTRTRNGQCRYIYTRKLAKGTEGKVASSRNQNYFDVQFLPCDSDDSDYNLQQINDTFESEAAHNFHFAAMLDGSDDGQCIYLFVRDLKVK